jgi:hypothetical protein
MVPVIEIKKGVVPPFDQWKLIAEIRIGIRIFQFSFFAFLYCKSAGIYILELVHWIFPNKELWLGYINPLLT